MDSRDQFEKWLATQNKERLSRGFPAYNGSDASMFMDAWQASREALVVEPVVVVDKNSAGQINLKRPDGDSFDMSKHIGETLYRIAP